MYVVVGFELAFSVISGIVVGHYLDKYFETEAPWFTIAGLILGAFAGFSFLIRMVKRLDSGKGRKTD